MPDSTRVPQPDEEFNTYITGTTTHLLILPSTPGAVPHWERLGLIVAEKDQWVAYRDDWNTKYQQVKTNETNGIRDKNATKAKNDAKKNFTEWVNDPADNKLTRIEASRNLTDQDRTVFHIKLRDTERTLRGQMTAAPYVDFKAEDGGIVLVTCQVAHDSDRPSMHPDADVIMMKYSITEVDDTPPATADDCPGSFTSKKAIFRFDAAANMPGKRIHAFLRWQNDSEKVKSGPWGQRMTIVIGD